jgi:outer membrane cobalamin receptor
MQNCIKSLVLVIFMFFSIFLKAQEKDTIDYDIFEMTFEDLLSVPVKAAGKTEQTIAEIPASTVVITRKDIEQFGYKSLREILNNIPGYYALSNLGIDIYGVRGFAKEQGNNFIVMINNTKITDEKILVNYQLPVECIERIEVIRGPMAVMYGNNAFFGVIHIITENPKPDVVDNNLFSFSYGTWNTMNTAFRIGTKQKDLRLNIDFGYYLTDGLDKPLANMMKRPEKMDEPLFGGINEDGLDLPENARSTKNYLSKSHKIVNITGGFKGFYFNSLLVESKNKHYYYFPSLDEGSGFEDFNSILSAGFRHEFSKSFSSDIQLRYSKFNSRYTYRILFEDFYGYDNYYITELETEANFFWNPSNKINITFGLQYENILEYINEGDVPSGGSPNMYWQFVNEGDEAVTVSLFSQISYKPVEKLNFVIGARAEKSFGYGVDFEVDKGILPDGDPNKTHFIGYKPDGDISILSRAAVIYTPSNNHVLKLLYGKALKRPTISDLGSDMSDISRGDKEDFVKPEFIETLELNYFSFVSNKLSFNLSAYINWLNDLIVERNAIEDDILRAWLSNNGRNETKGVELTIKSKPVKSLFLDFSGTYQKTEDMTFNTAGSYSPELLLNFKIAYQVNDWMKFATIVKYVGKMKPYFNTFPIFDANDQPTGEYVGRTTDDVPEYTTIDLNVRIEPRFIRNAFINFHITNLLDQDIFYPTFSRNSLWADKGTWGPGQEFLSYVRL